MNCSDILAVVVSFNGLNQTEETLLALSGKVGHIHVVDNFSDRESIEKLKQITDNSISFTYLTENKGLGFALNLGIEIANKYGYKWLLTMDQDSVIADCTIERYCDAINQNASLVCLSPTLSVFGKKFILNSSNKNTEIVFSIKYAITSGNLVKLDVCNEIGGYDESFFIDCIDFDFSLKLRNAGYKIHQVKDAVLYHSLGEEFNIPKIFSRFYTLHSPLRRYYMFRNWCFMIRRYFLVNPVFILKSTCLHFLLLCIILFYDKEPKKSLKYIFYGINDFFKNRKGQFIEK